MVTMGLISKNEENVRIFERKMLRKILRPKKIQYEYRTLWNREINEIIKGEHIVTILKSAKT